MPFKIVRNDITKMQVDAIVNAAKVTLLGGGGVDGAIHQAAGEELLAECRTLGGCPVGEARITGAYQLPCRYVIHTVGPCWRGGFHGEKRKLFSCYHQSLLLARKAGCTSVAFPLISSGAFGYPKEKALQVAIQAIFEFLQENDMMIYLVIYDKDSFAISQKLFFNISRYIDDHYVEVHPYERSVRAQRSAPVPMMADAQIDPMKDLEKELHQLDESFSQMLLRKIDESGLTDSQCYKRSNIDRKLFSKIRNDPSYRPSKPTALAFAIGLKLSLEETESFLRTAGFAFSDSSRFDIIIRYFIHHRIYDIYEINQTLFAFDQPLLGG